MSTPDTGTGTGTGLGHGVPALRLDGLTRRFGDLVALNGVDLSVGAGEIHCVLGENGAGKSTLCNVVFGGTRPSRGRMFLGGRAYAPSSPADAMRRGIAMVHQHFSLVPTLTVEQNLLLGRSRFRPDRRGLHRRLAEIEGRYGLGVDPGARVDRLSVGHRQTAEIVKALLGSPRLVLFDEPTGVLGPREIDAFLETARRIADTGTAVVLITHKLKEVRAIGDRATVLRHGEVTGGGPLTELPDDRLVDLMIGERTGDPLLAAALGRVPRTVPRPGPPGDRHGASGHGPEEPDGPVVLEVSGLAAEDAHGGSAVTGVDLAVRAGRIVGIAGVEGNGQSALVDALSGAVVPGAGTVRLAGADITRATPRERTRAGLAVIPEDRHREGVVEALSVAENLVLGRLSEFTGRFGTLDRSASAARAAGLAERFDVRSPGPDAPMSSLSGGNQQKAVLARELSLDPLTCVVAAHPTRGLDVGAVAAVVGHLRGAASRGAAVLMVSGELEELLAVCDEIRVAYRGALTGPVDTADPRARDRVARLMMGARA
ncbi:ABC transporter ATP-binding protein [Nocardiopsis ganjiahuensis]|uniref:ABC transporter ATP-binding protein n=1 Tax=Nocardiopsis ganjiahuensis TaxID=239984 RepID=UPI0003486ECD|nr:ABC transporter ATP-binding protein [Nocardiopsis ganjiahuensis]